MSTQTLRFEQAVKAPPAEVYRAFTVGTALREWMSDVATTNPHPGGRLYLAWNAGFYACGEFTALQPDQEIGFTWFGRGEPGPSQVKVLLTPAGGGTQVNLAHSDVGTGEAWSKTCEEIINGWKTSLENLASVLETGEDLRFIRRPMLGITISDFNAEIAKEMNVPVSQGLRLDGVVDGMGAQAAGLQNGDVIVRMADREITDWESLTSTLQAHQAGDRIEVVYYRGPERNTTLMELSGRPLPEIPASAEELAKTLEQRYGSMHSELEVFFSGVSEVQASHQPGPNDWSAKEILAHLIHGERGWQNFISEMVTGQEPLYDDFGGNLQARVKATVAVYPAVSELLEEYKRSTAETVALFANLPAEFLNRKGTFWRLAYNALESPYHFHTHLEQMRAAIEAARQ